MAIARLGAHVITLNTIIDVTLHCCVHAKYTSVCSFELTLRTYVPNVKDEVKEKEKGHLC